MKHQTTQTLTLSESKQNRLNYLTSAFIYLMSGFPTCQILTYASLTIFYDKLHSNDDYI